MHAALHCKGETHALAVAANAACAPAHARTACTYLPRENGAVERRPPKSVGGPSDAIAAVLAAQSVEACDHRLDAAVSPRTAVA